MWKNQLGIWQTARKDLGSFLGLCCAWHLPPPATFCLMPFSGPDWRVLQFLHLPYYRLGEPLQESIQQQWQTLFQQPKEEKKKKKGILFRLIVSLEGDMQPSQLEQDHHSPKHTVDAEMPEQTHGSLGLPGLMRAARVLLCWWCTNQFRSGNDMATFPGTVVHTQSLCFWTGVTCWNGTFLACSYLLAHISGWQIPILCPTMVTPPGSSHGKTTWFLSLPLIFLSSNSLNLSARPKFSFSTNFSELFQTS